MMEYRGVAKPSTDSGPTMVESTASCRRLRTSPGKGISESEVPQRQRAFGANSIPPKPPKTFLQLAFEAMQDYTPAHAGGLRVHFLWPSRSIRIRSKSGSAAAASHGDDTELRNKPAGSKASPSQFAVIVVVIAPGRMLITAVGINSQSWHHLQPAWAPRPMMTTEMTERLAEGKKSGNNKAADVRRRRRGGPAAQRRGAGNRAGRGEAAN
uniref:Cation_ATPase_N domain-containing protein n=1 Tax=Macrostomum lignano TaxID=282301 RepID=A0A1I8FNE4_9PLAT